MKILCEPVAVRGKPDVPEQAATAPQNHWPTVKAEKVDGGRIIPEPEDFPISVTKKQRAPAPSETRAEYNIIRRKET